MANNFIWIKYELQHALEYIHGAPIFDDYRSAFDQEHNSLISLEYPSFDMHNTDFFPLISDEGAKCF